MSSKVLEFRSSVRRAAQGGGARPSFAARCAQRLGDLLARFRAPGFIAPVEIEDKTTGQRITVTVGPLFTCLSVNGREFYFRRLTGRYDGAGMPCD